MSPDTEGFRKVSFNYGHVIAAACFSIQAIGVGTYVAYGVFFHSLMAEFGWSRTAISGAHSVSFFIMGIFGIFVGRLNDAFGPRKIMAVTAVFFGIGYALMSRVSTLWHLYLFYGLVFGIGMSSVDVIALTTTARWFVRKRGLMTGLVKVGTGAGQFTLPLTASFLITNYGWRNAYMIIGISAMLILLVIARLLQRDPGQTDPPMEGGAGVLPPGNRNTDDGLYQKQAVRTVQFWSICTVNLMLVFCLMSIMIHIVPHARDIGVSATKAAGVLSTIGAVSMIGRFITGIGIDRIGSKKMMVFCFFLLVFGLVWLQYASALWMLMIFACIYGIAHGGFFTAISPLVAEMFGIRSHGALLGIVIGFGSVGGALGPMLAGYIFDITNSYSIYFWLITFMGAVTLGLMSLLKPVNRSSA